MDPIFRLSILPLFLVLLCWGETAFGQPLWESEREKEHGILRVSISNSPDPLYYFVGVHPNGSSTDTLSNTEAHLDLGSLDPKFGYQIAPLVKAMPPDLYGRKGKHLYDNWEFVAFPILGLSSATVWMIDRSSGKRMDIHFTFPPSDTADYVFDFGFAVGSFCVDAAALKYTGSDGHQLARRELDRDGKIPSATRFDRAISRVIRSMTSNRMLDIVEVSDPEPFRCFRFNKRLRYLREGPESVAVAEHPWYTKVKYRSPVQQLAVPDYMAPDPDDDQQKVYCVEHVYVKPVCLHTLGASYDPFVRSVNRRMSGAVIDTTFLALETLLEGWLFSQSLPCNWPVYTSASFSFPFNADSILSVEMKVEERLLPADDTEAVLRYSLELDRVEEKNKRKQNKHRRISRARFLKEAPQAPLIPSASPPKLPLPNLEIEVPRACDSLLNESGTRFLNNGYYSWEPVLPCYSMDSARVESVYYRAIVLNPYTLEPYLPEQLFGEGFREVVYAEMELRYGQMQEEGSKHPFNLYHYLPQARRRIMWGLTNESVIIYYGNEGEFGAWYTHRIDLRRFVD